MCKIEKDYGITQETKAFFEPSKFMIWEATVIPLILALLWTIRATNNIGTDAPVLPLLRTIKSKNMKF